MAGNLVPISQLAAALTAVATLSLSDAASASVGLFNTGVDNNQAVLALGATDPHYTVSGGSPTYAVNDAQGFPGFWLAPSAGSEWITPLLGPGNTASSAAATGNYVYTTHFNLSGIDLTKSFIHGLVTADNGITDILINGHSTGFTYGGPNSGAYASFTPFTINSGFQTGLNTLSFDVVNGAGPTGLRTDFTGSTFAAAVPEPQTWALLLAGLATIGASWRRRSTPLV